MEQYTDLAEVKKAIEANSLCLLFIKTANCGVCDAVFEKTNELLENFPMVKGILLSLENTPQASAEYLVFTAPTLLLFAEGREVMRASRFVMFENLEYELKRWSEII